MPRTESQELRIKAFFFHLEDAAFTNTISNAHPNFPLSGLCDLCAMLSSLRVVLARKPPLSTKQFPRDVLLNGSSGKSASEPRTLPVHYPRRPQSLPGFSPRS